MIRSLAIQLLPFLVAMPALAGPPKVAVFDFRTMGASKEELVLFMEQILNEVDATGKFKSIGKSDLETMLGMEKLKENLGNDCNESCMAEIAGSIGAEYVLAGNLIKSSDGYAVLIKLIDQNRAEVVKRVDREVRGGFSDLRKAVSGIVREVLGLGIAIKGAKGELALKITPDNASYSIDGGRFSGKLMPGVLNVVLLPAGAHKVTLSAKGYEDLTEDELVEANRVVTLERALLRPMRKKAKAASHGKGYLDIVTSPADTEGADIFLDGELRPEKTPVTLKGLPAGDHVLAIRKPLYREWRERVVVRDGQLKKIEARLKPNFGPVSIDSEPSGADVYIDGVKVGVTPYKEARREAKAYKLKLTRSLYHDFEETMFVEAVKGLKSKVRLKPAFGILKADTGDVTGADVLIDGQPRCKTPCTLTELASRRYYVKVTKELYAPWEKEVEIRDGQVQAFKVNLEARFGTLNVESKPKGATVLLDGKPIGQTPLTRKLSIGSYRLEVNAGEGYKPHVESFVLGKNDVKSVDVELVPRLGSVMISANVRGARIQIDGEERGVTPMLVKDLLVGEHEARLSADKHIDTVKKVRIKEGEVMELQVNLTRLLPREIADREIAKWKDEQARYHMAGWLLTAAAVGLGITASVLGYLGSQDADESDKSYEQYLRADNEAEAARLRARTQDIEDSAGLKYSLAWALGGGAVAALAGGIVAFVLSPDRPVLHVEGEVSVLPAPVRRGKGIVLDLGWSW